MKKLFKRRAYSQVIDLLANYPAVLLVGPRQVGKTTLALEIAKQLPSVYLNLEDASNYHQLVSQPKQLLKKHSSKLIIIDEVQQVPSICGQIMVQIDKREYLGQGAGQFLLLGSTSDELLRRTQNLAGRETTLRLHGLNLLEAGGAKNLEQLLTRGGFPRSFMQAEPQRRQRWLADYIVRLLNKDIKALGIRSDADKLAKLLTKIAHTPGRVIKTDVAGKIGTSDVTVQNHLEVLVNLFVLNCLPGFHKNLGKQAEKIPRYYLCDSGLVQSICNSTDEEGVPQDAAVKQGLLWEGFVIENVLSVLPDGWQPYYFRTPKGKMEVDLLLRRPGGKLWAIEIKTSYDDLKHSYTAAVEFLKPQRRFVVQRDEAVHGEFVEAGRTYEVLPLPDLMQLLVQQDSQQ